MKRLVCMMMTLVLAATCLTACGGTGGGKTADNKPAAPSTSQQAEEKTLHGVINRIDNYLVILTDDGEYQVMDYGDGVTLDDYAEGDSVNVTYTGELGVEGSNPVITAISKAN